VWGVGVLLYLVAIAGGLLALTAKQPESDETADAAIDSIGGR
jgi:hypothetical protein